MRIHPGAMGPVADQSRSRWRAPRQRAADATACVDSEPPGGQSRLPATRYVTHTRMGDVTNTEIAEALDELGDLSELDGAAIYRVVAYRNAAKAVRESPVSVPGLARQGRATELPGV